MKKFWEQITVARFYMTDKGEVLNLTDMPPADLIQDRVKRPVTGASTHPTAGHHIPPTDNDEHWEGP